MARKHATCLILAALLLVACEGVEPSVTDEPSGTARPSPSDGAVRVVGDPHHDCPNADEVAVSVDSRGQQTLSGDVDGDGAEDEVWLSTDERAPGRCGHFIMIETADRIYWAATDTSDVSSSLEVPTLNSLADIDADGDVEIVVNLDAGASTQFVGVFALTRAGLERMTVDGRRPGPFGAEMEGLFAYGGSVGHLEAVDCVDGHVVLSAAIPSGSPGTYEVERRFFSPAETVIVIVGELTEKHIVRDLKIDDFPEFAGSPFQSCD